MSDRGTEIETQTERQTERQRGKETKRQRQAERDRMRQRETERDRGRQRETERDREREVTTVTPTSRTRPANLKLQNTPTCLLTSSGAVDSPGAASSPSLSFRSASRSLSFHCARTRVGWGVGRALVWRVGGKASRREGEFGIFARILQAILPRAIPAAWSLRLAAASNGGWGRRDSRRERERGRGRGRGAHALTNIANTVPQDPTTAFEDR